MQLYKATIVMYVPDDSIEQWIWKWRAYLGGVESTADVENATIHLYSEWYGKDISYRILLLCNIIILIDEHNFEKLNIHNHNIISYNRY